MHTTISPRALAEAGIAQLAAWMEQGTLTSEELVLFYLERIRKYNPRLNAILEVNPDALFLAQAMDAERARSGPRSRMHGIPIVIKDNISTGDRLHTSAGSLALADLFAPEDAFVVNMLRRAGAVILGKANMMEFANFTSTSAPEGYSSRGGLVVSAYGKSHTPSGSSSGSGVAAAASLAAAAVGTETDGSIIAPCVCSGVVGIKPTVGLVSRTGIIPISHRQDTAGPMARSVEDAAILLGAMVGIDEADPATWKSRGACADYAQFVRRPVAGMRVGINRQACQKLAPERRGAVEAAEAALSSMGVEFVDVPLSCPEDEILLAPLHHEFKAGVNHYLSTVRGRTKMTSLADIIAFNNAHPEQCLRYGQDLLEKSQAVSGTLTEPEYLEAVAEGLRLTRDPIDAAFREHRLDAFLLEEGISSLAPVSGYPAITVPAGLVEGDPIPAAFSLLGTAFSEGTLITLAYAYEQATHKRVVPDLDE